MSILKVMVLELTSGEDVGANAEHILSLLKSQPVDAAPDLVCLPENSLFLRISKGIAPKDMRLDDPNILKLKKFSDERNWPIVIGSVPLIENAQRLNATVFLEPGHEPRAVYRKLHLFDVDVPGAPPSRESDAFAYGPKPELLEWRGWKIGLSICYDLRFSELYRSYAQAGADLLLIPSAFLVPTGQAHWETLVRARAIESQCYVVASAQGGEHVSVRGDKRYTYGHSLVVGPWGEKLMELSIENRVGLVQLDKAQIEKVRRQIPMRQHRANRKWETLK